jgi:quercetin dioxygenase-like cupin family protein
MYTANERDVPEIKLPGRTCKVMVGSNVLTAKNMTFGVTRVPPYGKMTPHIHKNEEEVIYILEGSGSVVVNNTEEVIEPGSAIYLPAGSEHFIHNKSADAMRFVFSFSPPVIVGSYNSKPSPATP